MPRFLVQGVQLGPVHRTKPADGLQPMIDEAVMPGILAGFDTTATVVPAE